MRTPIKAVFVTLALAGASTALAGCVVAPGGGGGQVAFGYSDGYWDREHHWHTWANSQDAARFRSSDNSHYYNRRHDEDPRNQGWNDNDRYWDHR
jgi:hypothetical protein